MQHEPTRLTWEEAVVWLRAQPDRQEIVKACFFDDPLIEAAERYHASSEWRAVRKLIPRATGCALDLGAGRGIGAFALAKDGWTTTALEPDPSEIVGAGAIRRLIAESGCPIRVVEAWGEALPFENRSFDLVHVRQALHHAGDLRQLCREIARVLKPGGMLIATREHVLSNKSDLPRFLETHSVHRLFGGEHAYLLEEYTAAIKSAGLRLVRVLNPLQSDINTFPGTLQSVKQRYSRKLNLPFAWLVPTWLLRLKGARMNDPGRLYSFVGVKPH